MRGCVGVFGGETRMDIMNEGGYAVKTDCEDEWELGMGMLGMPVKYL